MGDPRCAYVAGRWFNLVYNTVGNFSWVTIGVSNSSNPTGAYKIYNVDTRLIGLVSGCTATDPCFGATGGRRGRRAPTLALTLTAQRRLRRPPNSGPKPVSNTAPPAQPWRQPSLPPFSHLR